MAYVETEYEESGSTFIQRTHDSGHIEKYAKPAAHVPEPINLTPYQFLTMLPAQTRAANRLAAKQKGAYSGVTDEQVAALEDFVDMLKVAQDIRKDDPNLINGLAFLVTLGTITQNQIDTLLAEWPEA